VSILLTTVMAQAVPEVYVESARVVREPRGLYWIRVTPYHPLYWCWFRELYPQCGQALSKYVLKEVKQEFDRACPEFFKREDLIEWISDVLDLSKGVRKLLQIREGC